MIAVIVTLKAKEGRGEDLVATLREAMERTCADEPGCILYRIARAREDNAVFKVFQIYASQQALDDHRRTPHAQIVGARLAEQTAEPGVVEFLDVIE